MTPDRMHALGSRMGYGDAAKKLLSPQSRGLALFRANYADDHLPRITAEGRHEMAGHTRCIACGRCNLGDGERMAASGGAYPGTMALMLSSSRDHAHFAAAKEAFAWISDQEVAQKEGTCPPVPDRASPRSSRQAYLC